MRALPNYAPKAAVSPFFKIHGESRQGAKNAWASG